MKDAVRCARMTKRRNAMAPTLAAVREIPVYDAEANARPFASLYDPESKPGCCSCVCDYCSLGRLNTRYIVAKEPKGDTPDRMRDHCPKG